MGEPNLAKFYQETERFDFPCKTILEYIWIDGTGINMRSKTRIVDHPVSSLEDIPEWNYDGSSCYQATTINSEVILKAVAYYPDPFRKGNCFLVLCETFVWADEHFTELAPANTNFRHFTAKIFQEVMAHKPWFGIEQEYTLLSQKSKFHTQPLGWPNQGFPEPQGPYYCSVGASTCFGRIINEDMIKASLYAGLKISGTNQEVMPGQWEYQIGPCEGLTIGDMLWISRYILIRVAEQHGVSVSFDPKLFKNWNGAGCHTNYSTFKMREGEGGMDYVYEVINKLGKRHSLHLDLYGDNSGRLTGKHETSSKDEFTFGIGNRAASVRIPTATAHYKKGYIEDRRPASDIDPYVVAAVIIDSTLVERTMVSSLVAHYKDWQSFKKNTFE